MRTLETYIIIFLACWAVLMAFTGCASTKNHHVPTYSERVGPFPDQASFIRWAYGD